MTSHPPGSVARPTCSLPHKAAAPSQTLHRTDGATNSTEGYPEMSAQPSTTRQSAIDAALIHPVPTTADMVASASVAAVFLDSLSIRPYTLRVTELGRVEAYVDPALFDRARRVLLSEGATVHNEDGFVYVEARLDGVPVQVWTAVES